MVCYHPLIAVDVTKGAASKKVIQVIGSAELNPALYVKAQKDEHSYIVPCGQCVGCRLERSRFMKSWKCLKFRELGQYWSE